MNKFVCKQTGKVKTKKEIIKDNFNISIPQIWNEEVCNFLNIEPVFTSPKPKVKTTQKIIEDGIVKDANGNWIEKWKVVDLFSDDIHSSKEEKEKKHKEEIEASVAAHNRDTRNKKLQETDWWAVVDRTMSVKEKEYRQALRDITTHPNWPELSQEDWPTKP